MPPTISGVRPAAGAQVKGRTPTISALVQDDITELAKAKVHLSIDGRGVTKFAYSQATDRLSFIPTNNLSYGRHTVEVKATDGANQRANKIWSFKECVSGAPAPVVTLEGARR
jgi:hypothetical protein